MKKAIDCARYDFYMVMVYRKTFWLFFLMPFDFPGRAASVLNAIYVSAVMAIMMLGYPFSIEEKSRADVRLRTMPVAEMVWAVNFIPSFSFYPVLVEHYLRRV